MGWRTPPLLAWITWLLLASHLLAQTPSSTDFVRSLYRKYLQREPSSNELTQWVWSFQKGLALTDAQATFLSSDEYFRRMRSDPATFVAGLYADVLNRAPTANESTQWVRGLAQLKGDRARLVREFLKAAQRQSSVAAALPAQEPSQREGQLVATARLLQNALADELGGTRQGRQLTVMSRNLVNASRSLEQAAEASGATYQQAFDDVQAAVGAIAGQLAQLHFSAPTSSTYLLQYQQILGSLGGVSSRPTPLPAENGPPQSRPAADAIDTATYQQLVQISTTMLTDTNQVIAMLQSTAGQSGVQNQLLRDVEFFSAQAAAVQRGLQPQKSQAELRSEVLRLRALAQGITRSMQTTGQMGWVTERWGIVSDDLQELGERVGVSAGPTINPGQPVLIRPPTYFQLPYQVQRSTADQLSSQAIPITERAMAHVDALIVGFNRFLPLSPRVPGLQAQARGLRMTLAQFRDELTKSESTALLKLQLNQINQTLQALNATWTQTVQERRLTGAPDLSDVASSIQSLNQLFQGS